MIDEKLAAKLAASEEKLTLVEKEKVRIQKVRYGSRTVTGIFGGRGRRLGATTDNVQYMYILCMFITRVAFR